MAISSDVTIIEPPRAWWRIDFQELWQYRELFGSLVARDFRVRYKQSLLGFMWAIIGPLSNAFVFAVLFGKVANMPTDGLPEGLFYMAGLVIWGFFSRTLTGVSGSLIANQALLTKIYIPRLIIPISAMLRSAVDFSIGFAVLILLILSKGTLPAATIVLVPLLVFIAGVTALGVGLFFAAMNVRYRDARNLVGFITQIWMYSSVIVPFSRIPEEYGNLRYLYGLNPMGGVVEGFRWCLLHHKMDNGAEAPLVLLAIGTAVMVSIFPVGLYFFKRMECQFADIV